MTFALVGVRGKLAGRRFAVGAGPVGFGRDPGNDVVLDTPLASRLHAELRIEAGAPVLYDRGSRNGTSVDGRRIDTHRLQDGEEITIGNEVFRFEVTPLATVAVPVPVAEPAPLRVTVSGGGPVGLAFALLLDDLMGPRAAITVHDGRWLRDGERLRWKTVEEGNLRRLQVVTIQSRQFTMLPAAVREHLFTQGDFTQMWPSGPDSVDGLGPRNIRIALVEDRLLELANDAPRIRLVPENLDPDTDPGDQHVLAICEGGRSSTREHFAERFGAADASMYSLDGEQVQDMVLGLRVRSELPDPMAVLLTVAQNRFLLNSLSGEGFLNMRLTSQETAEAVGIDPVRQLFAPCLQTAPCVMDRTSASGFHCVKHQAFFLPAVLKGSAFWQRVQEGLKLFGVAEEDLTAITGFRLAMVQRPRFTAQLFPRTATTPGTFGFLLGDAANAIHFWPGRGLNSGLASAVSLARCLAARWRGTVLRDADFTRHEALMAMLQYRHKSRAWRQMVTTDESGETHAIKDRIAAGIDSGAPDRAADIAALMKRLRGIRDRLAARLDGLPDDATLQARLEMLADETLHTLRVSQAWDSAAVGGEEVDVEWLLVEPEPAAPVARAA